MAANPTVQRVASALQTLLPRRLPPSLSHNPANLYEVLSRTAGPAGKCVYQTRWTEKGIHDCYWEVTDAKFKLEGKHGKAWGKLYWKGE
jgi:small subunit ribosomal protein S34